MSSVKSKIPRNCAKLCYTMLLQLLIFKGITSDLFPGVTLPEPDYVILNTAVDDTCKVQNMQNTPFFLEKVQQLYEMIIVRHGLMIVGLPFGGKTSSYRILADALGLIEERVINILSHSRTHWCNWPFFRVP